MSTIKRLRALLATLTEDCAPGPWHGVESGDRAAYGWWLENPAGDSSYPDPNYVAAMLNALPALLDVAEAAQKWRDHIGTPQGEDNSEPMLLWAETEFALAERIFCALDRLGGAS
jgi:hypothetical protein